MKKMVIRPKGNKKPVKASNAWFNAARVSLIKNKVSSLMDIIESCDAETYEAIDGEAMFDDLLTYAQQLDALIRPVE